MQEEVPLHSACPETLQKELHPRRQDREYEEWEDQQNVEEHLPSLPGEYDLQERVPHIVLLNEEASGRSRTSSMLVSCVDSFTFCVIKFKPQDHEKKPRTCPNLIRFRVEEGGIE
jgi:hypothetical protein